MREREFCVFIFGLAQSLGMYFVGLTAGVQPPDDWARLLTMPFSKGVRPTIAAIFASRRREWIGRALGDEPARQQGG
jgi:hypothetical protein